MKRFICLYFASLFLMSCQEQVDSLPETNSLSKKLEKQANTDDVNAFDAPKTNPIKKLLFTTSKNLNAADSIYRAEIEKSNAKAYCHNLKELGFIALVHHGLIEDGTKEQKEFYINEQMNSQVNLPNFKNFYALLSSCQDDFSRNELQDFGEDFYTKNKNYIENKMQYRTVENEKRAITKLNSAYESFKNSLK